MLSESFKKEFNNNILNTIKEFEKSMFLIQQDESRYCTCMDINTLEGNPNCPKCLGMGYKIKIKKIKAARQDTELPDALRPTSEILLSTILYMDNKYGKLKRDNIIVDNQDVFYIYQPKQERGFNSKDLYQKAFGLAHKILPTFYVNFNKIIKGE